VITLTEMEHIERTLKRMGKKVTGVELVRTGRDEGKQDVAFNSRPFVLCGQPLRRPPKDQLKHERRNGKWILTVTADASYGFGLPFGQDRLIPIWLSTLATQQKSQTIRFSSAAEMLRAFGLPNNGHHYRRMMEAFQRVFYSNIYFGNSGKADRLVVERFHYIDKMQLWYAKNTDQEVLGEGFENYIQLAPAFYEELQLHPIPVDMGVVQALASAPGLLDLYMWLSYRCKTATGPVEIPLFGVFGLSNQLGMADQQNFTFRQTIKRWLVKIRKYWPDCPAKVSADGEYLLLRHALAILPKPTTTL
jgi:hypothetical protein